MSSEEFTEWIAFFTLEPFGSEVENWRAALPTAMIANTVRDSKKKPQPFQPADFMPNFEAASEDDEEAAARRQMSLQDRINLAMQAFGDPEAEE